MTFGIQPTPREWIDQHVLSLEMRDSSEKDWINERTSDYKTEFFLKDGTFNLFLKSGGGFSRPYKAFLFKENEGSAFDYTILIKDMLEISEARLPTRVSIPMKPYVQTGSKVKFLILGKSFMATILGFAAIE